MHGHLDVKNTKIHSAAQSRTQPVSVIQIAQFMCLSKQSLFSVRIKPNIQINSDEEQRIIFILIS